MTFKVGDRIRFAEERQRYTVRAVSSDGRWVICTKPFNPRRTVLYTVIDTVRMVRGVDNSYGLGYETLADIQAAIEAFEAGTVQHSHRRRPIPVEIVEHTPSAV